MRTLFILALAALISAGLFTPWMFGETRGTQTASSIEAPFPLVFPDDFDWGVPSQRNTSSTNSPATGPLLSDA